MFSTWRPALLLVVSLWIAAPGRASEVSFQDLQILLVRGQYAELEKISTQELKEKPNSLRALYFLYASYDNQGATDRALDSLLQFEKSHRAQTPGDNLAERTLGIDFRFLRAYYALGAHYFEQKQYPAALEWLVMSQPLYHADPVLQHRLAVSYQRIGDFEQARVHYFLQKELEPKKPSISYNISCSYAQEGDAKKSLFWLKKAVRSDKKLRYHASGDAAFDAIRATQEFQDFLRKNS